MKPGQHSLWCIPVISALLAFSLPTRGAVIYQSATLGPPDDQGWDVDSTQYLGTRFTLNNTTDVQAIGGDMYANVSGPLWGAIVPLSGPTGLPTGNPLNSALASVTFTLPGVNQQADYSIPLSVELQPGTYGLIFGAQSEGTLVTMPWLNVDIPGQASYFAWYQNAWHNGSISNTRFVVYGEAVPEPGTPVLFALFGVTAVLKRRPWRCKPAV